MCRVWSVERAMRHVWSAAPATQNDDRDLRNAVPATKTATHLVKTRQKYCACHTKRLSTGYQTGWSVTKCRACHAKRIKTTWQLAWKSWKPSRRRGFAASPIDAARPQENQKLEMRHVGASKRAFPARRPPLLTLCSIKIDVFLRVFLRTWKFATSKSMFRARLPSIFITSHKMPPPPRNLHLVATWLSPDNAIRKKHATRHV